MIMDRHIPHTLQHMNTEPGNDIGVGSVCFEIFAPLEVLNELWGISCGREWDILVFTGLQLIKAAFNLTGVLST